MKVLAIIFVVLICVYAVVSLVGLVSNIILRKKQCAELQDSTEEHDQADGVAESSDEDNAAD